MTKRLALRGSALLAVALLAGLLWKGWSEAPRPLPATAPADSSAAAPWVDGDAGSARKRASQPFPDATSTADAATALLERWQRSSLRGSEVDGELGLDRLGRLRADAGLRRLFDHALSLQGEFSLAEIRSLIGHWVEARHGGSVRDEAVALFDRYLALKRAESELDGIRDPADRLARLIELRRAHIGADADAMFGAEETYTAHTLARLALLREPGRDDQDRARALAELDARRPAAQREAEALALSPTLLAEHESLLDAENLDPAQREAERRALWGEDAARRLAELDEAEADWQARLNGYAAARQRILGDPHLAAADREAALQDLLRQRFSESERRRVASLQAIGMLPRGG